MRGGYLLFLAVFVLAGAWLDAAQAETVLERVARTGQLRAGTRTNAAPFGYINKAGAIDGYGVELMQLIQRRLQEKLGRTVTLDLRTVDTNNRLTTVAEGEVDIVCEAATITPARLEKVNFSIPFFISGAQFLLKKAQRSTFNVNGTLEKLPIAYVPGTTTSDIIPKIYPLARWLAVENRIVGIQKLNQGQVKAVVSDGILLLGELVNEGNSPRNYALTPSQPMTTELYGCILPKLDQEWKQFVDQAIASEENHNLQSRWFNEEGSEFPNIVRTDSR
jgi:polar amino acid transport system substrate-binding protein